MDCVGDRAGEAAVLRSRKGFFNHFARFPDSLTGMASMRIFGGKRCSRTSGNNCKGKLTAARSWKDRSLRLDRLAANEPHKATVAAP